MRLSASLRGQLILPQNMGVEDSSCPATKNEFCGLAGWLVLHIQPTGNFPHLQRQKMHPRSSALSMRDGASVRRSHRTFEVRALIRRTFIIGEETTG